jgi:hypothetical protein
MSRLVFWGVLLSCYILGTDQYIVDSPSLPPDYTLNFDYSVDCLSSSLNDVQSSDKQQNSNQYTVAADPDDVQQCSNVLTAEYINPRIQTRIVEKGASFVGNRKGAATFSPIGSPMRDCCHSIQCTGCFQSDRCVYRISHPTEKVIVLKGRCLYCQQRDCPRTCPFGTVKTNPTCLFFHGFKPDPLACLVGAVCINICLYQQGKNLLPHRTKNKY